MRPPTTRRWGVHGALGFLVIAGGLASTACQTAAEQQAASLLRARCGRCHPEERALQKRKTTAQWKRTVWSMRQRGAQLSDAEAEILVEYLSRSRSR